jgi:hypothetical protein
VMGTGVKGSRNETWASPATRMLPPRAHATWNETRAAVRDRGGARVSASVDTMGSPRRADV